MAPTSKNSRKSLSKKFQLPGSTIIDKENAFLHSVSEFHSRIRRRESIRLKYKVSRPKYHHISGFTGLGKVVINLFVIIFQFLFKKFNNLYSFSTPSQKDYLGIWINKGVVWFWGSFGGALLTICCKWIIVYYYLFYFINHNY